MPISSTRAPPVGDAGPTDDVRWVGGALWVSNGGHGILVDAPPLVHQAVLAEGLLDRLQAIIITSARTRALSGLLQLWEAMSLRKRRTLELLHILGDERTPAIAHAWSLAWPDGIQLNLDGLAPGTSMHMLGIDIDTIPLRLGEPAPSDAGIRVVAGCGLKVHTAARSLAWVPTCRAGTAVTRLCTAVDLAVLQLAPHSPTPSVSEWGMGLSAAELAGAAAGARWIVDDAGVLQSPIG